VGDYYQTIVDRDVGEEAAPDLASAIRGWLIAEGIIGAATSGCALGGKEGYPPGPHYAKATERACPRLLQTRPNGLEIIPQRDVFYSLTGEDELVCAACSRRFEHPEGWGDAVAEWYHRRGPGLLACPACGATRPITEWPHDPAWGFGNLGFQFWNWPRLKTSFIEDVSRRLGHRVVLALGKW
jgi:hypothetical protein